MKTFVAKTQIRKHKVESTEGEREIGNRFLAENVVATTKKIRAEPSLSFSRCEMRWGGVT